MTSATIQLGLFGTTYPVSPDCSVCERPVTGEHYTNLDGETLCKTCFDAAGLFVCPSCGETVERSDCAENPGGDLWCDNCINDDCFICDHCDGLAWEMDRATVVGTGRLGSNNLCACCAETETTRCDDCGETVYNNDSVNTAGGGTICQSCYENDYIVCEGCGDVIHNDDAYCNDYGCYCEDCRPRSDNFPPVGFRNCSGCVTEIGSIRCYGIELETDECDGYSELADSGAWGAKDDCTVSGKEFYSDILDGDAGLHAIRDWAKLATKGQWQAGDCAGYHLHLDMRSESDDTLYAIAYAYRSLENVWLNFVQPARRSNSYCYSCRWNCRDIVEAAENTSFYSWACSSTRYNWCNVRAYTQHTTFEIRAHQGTCNEDEVINWVKANTRFADWAASKGFKGIRDLLDGLDDAEKFDLIAREAWQDNELRAYYVDKAKKYAGVQF